MGDSSVYLCGWSVACLVLNEMMHAKQYRRLDVGWFGQRPSPSSMYFRALHILPLQHQANCCPLGSVFVCVLIDAQVPFACIRLASKLFSLPIYFCSASEPKGSECLRD